MLIQMRRGTAAQWVTANPTLAAGEIGFETDTGKVKIGTGAAAWPALPYVTDTVAASVTAAFATKVAKGDLVYNVKDYGAVGNGIADDTAAIDAAYAAASAVRGELFLPPGTYNHTGNLTVATDRVSISGSGAGSEFRFVNGGLVVDGYTVWRLGTSFRNFRIRRTGTVGAACTLLGHGAGTGAADFTFSNVSVTASTGDGLLIKGSYIGSFLGFNIRGCVTGLRIENERNVGSPGYTSGNLISFFGGEIQGNQVGGVIEGALGVTFHGYGIEGNTLSGIEWQSGVGLGFYGCYFESNGYSGADSWDLLVGTAVGGPDPKGLVVLGCFLTNALAVGEKTSSIQILRSRNMMIEANSFWGYETTAPVEIVETTVGTVEGTCRNNSNTRTTGFGPIVSLNGVDQDGFDTSVAPLKLTTASKLLKRHFTGQAAPDLASIPANSTTTFAITAVGAATGDDATAHPNSAPEAGLVWSAVVTAANTVTVTVANVTAAAIDPAARTWRVNVWGH